MRDMAVTAGRLDDVTGNRTSGRITVKITTGEAPLPLTWQGQSLLFSGAEVLREQLAALKARLRPDELALLQLLSAVERDPTLGVTFEANCRAKTCTLDLTGAVNVIAVG